MNYFREQLKEVAEWVAKKKDYEPIIISNPAKDVDPQRIGFDGINESFRVNEIEFLSGQLLFGKSLYVTALKSLKLICQLEFVKVGPDNRMGLSIWFY